jgi:hypothetical protein
MHQIVSLTMIGLLGLLEALWRRTSWSLSLFAEGFEDVGGAAARE